ncbi:Na/Pi cotransporter family protein [Motiliproteus sp. SC1-56]|uniref:Na/Pi cotransporter family protein n=1 Tax=Motiliproteus sp. SC1-56 TaxID=2799565 RepID=UPI001A8E82FB|nr:Na/Pi cotransporter family protein [Motiliproteus sp. SC1-56]
MKKGILIGLALLLSGAILAAQGAAPAMPWGSMLAELLGGLALFLFGMEMMAASLKAVAGDRMRVILARLTKNRLMGAATGALVTAVIQSSSVTTVLVVGFITANLMTLSQAVGVIMGANVGTTITAQIVAFKVTQYALPMLTLGFALQFFSKRDTLVHYGSILMGLGLIFFGMALMGQGMEPLRQYPPFLQLMQQMSAPLYGILLAAAFTALVQSSSATTGIVIVMASQGLIPLTTGIALIFGANIGTCITALLACIGKPRTAIQAGVVHMLFNVLGVALWFFFIDQLAQLVVWLSPNAPHLEGPARLAAEVPRQIANAHTVFNVANTLVFLLFTPQLARLVTWLVPELPAAAVPTVQPKYLTSVLLETPSLALDAARREIARIGSRVDDMLQEVLPAIVSGNGHRLDQIEQMDEEVDTLHRAIIRYLGEISKANLSQQQTDELILLMEAVNDLENVGDQIETNLVSLGRRKISEGIEISEPTQRVLQKLQAAVAETLHEATEAVVKSDLERARQVMERKTDIERLVSSGYQHQAERLVIDAPHRVSAYRLEIDTIERLKHIYYYAKRVAKAVVAIDALNDRELEPKAEAAS